MRRIPAKRIADFFESEARSGLVLVAVAFFALVWANSPWPAAYFGLWERQIGPLTIHHWVNDGLMTVFFLLVGLEIKRELVIGELSSRSKALLPMVAAAGGMVVPALMYVAFNAGSETARGWGIPMATDIAFALGILALAGPRIPQGLRVFLAALAIVDDLGAVFVIALFYTEKILWTALLGMAICLVVLVVMNRRRVRQPWAYALVGIPLWLFTLQSGVHATIAGVLLAISVPTFRVHADWTPLERMETAIGPYVRIFIVPLFALVNAGVSLTGGGVGNPLGWGVIAGLVLGKPIGIVGATLLAVKLTSAELPRRVGKRLLLGAGLVAGIGFTMSLFITGLAFKDAQHIETAKAAVLLASAVSGFLGLLWLRSPAAFGSRRQRSLRVARADGK